MPERPPLCTAELVQARKIRGVGRTTPDLSPCSRCGLPTARSPHSHRDWPLPACAGRSRAGFRRSSTGGRRAWSWTAHEVPPLPRIVPGQAPCEAWSLRPELRSPLAEKRRSKPLHRREEGHPIPTVESARRWRPASESAPDARPSADRRRTRKIHWCNAWETNRIARDNGARRGWGRLLPLLQTEPFARWRGTASSADNRVLRKLLLASSSRVA